MLLLSSTHDTATGNHCFFDQNFKSRIPETNDKMPPRVPATGQQQTDRAPAIAVAHIRVEGPEGNGLTEEQVARLLPSAPAVLQACVTALDREKTSLIAEVERRRDAAIAEVERNKATAIAKLKARDQELDQREKAFEDEKRAARGKNKDMKATLSALLQKIKDLAVVSSQAAQPKPNHLTEAPSATNHDQSSQPVAPRDESTTSIPHKVEPLSNVKDHSSDRHRPNMDTPDEDKEDRGAPDQSEFTDVQAQITRYLARYEVCNSDIPPTFTAGFLIRLLDNEHWRENFEDYHLNGPKGIPLCITAVAMRGLDCEEHELADCYCDGDRHAVLRGFCIRVEKLQRQGGPVRFTRDRGLKVVMVPLWRSTLGGV